MAHDNIAILKKAYEAFGRGDIPGVVELFADKLEHFGIISATKTGVPWHMQDITTKAEVPRYFAALGGTVEFTHFEPLDFAASGDYVYAWITMQSKVRATGKPLPLAEVVHRFKFKNGKIVGWRASEDTAHTMSVVGA